MARVRVVVEECRPDPAEMVGPPAGAGGATDARLVLLECRLRGIDLAMRATEAERAEAAREIAQERPAPELRHLVLHDPPDADPLAAANRVAVTARAMWSAARQSCPGEMTHARLEEIISDYLARVEAAYGRRDYARFKTRLAKLNAARRAARHEMLTTRARTMGGLRAKLRTVDHALGDARGRGEFHAMLLRRALRDAECMHGGAAP